MRRGIISILIATSICWGVTAISAHQDHTQKGAEKIVLHGGRMGDIPFPHLKHQETLDDCKQCHNLFAHEKGAIQKAITANVFKKKTVMDQCRGCHQQMKKANKKTGPTSCKKCHTQ